METDRNGDHDGGVAAAAVWPDRYTTLAALADLLRAGGPGLRRQPSRAAELYEVAAEEAYGEEDEPP